METKYPKVTISLPEDILQDYKKFCKINGMNISSRIAILLRKDLREKKERGEE